MRISYAVWLKVLSHNVPSQASQILDFVNRVPTSPKVEASFLQFNFTERKISRANCYWRLLHIFIWYKIFMDILIISKVSQILQTLNNSISSYRVMKCHVTRPSLKADMAEQLQCTQYKWNWHISNFAVPVIMYTLFRQRLKYPLETEGIFQSVRAGKCELIRLYCSFYI
jgi:hypothetical protein